MAGIEAKKITKGLAINRRKGFVLKIPHYLFTDYGKLVNGSAFDMNWTAQHFNQNISDKQRDFSGGELKALISISELTAEVITNYSKQQNRDVLQKLVQSIEDAIGSDRMERVIDDYCSDFLKIKRSHKRRSDKAFLVQDILLNWLNNINSAFRPYKAIFDNSGFLGKTDAVFFVQEMVSFLDSDDNNTDSKIPILSLYRILREPAEKFPDSIFDQLEFISEYWREYLDDTTELLKVIDILREEQVRFGGVPGAMPVIDYKNVSIYEDEEYY